MATLPAAQHAHEVYDLLGKEYGIRTWYARRDPMHELISTILSHRTTGANEETAYTRMRERFPTWEAVRDAPVDELAAAIAPCNWPEVKAPRIKAVLKQIIDERGSATIDFLADLPVDQAQQWLEALPGVGPKTATLVLLFCFHKPVLPVDTHVHRVSQRLGLIGPTATPDQAHLLLPPLLPHDADVYWNFHHNMLRHGQRICVWKAPRCPRCVLRNDCAYRAEHETVSGGQNP